MENTYSIPEANLPTFRDDIARLAKRAAKLGLPAVTMAEGAAADVPYVRGHAGDYAGETLRPWVGSPEQGSLAALEGRVVYRRFVAVTIAGEAPTAAGWEFVATLQHLDGEDSEPLAVLRVVPGYDGQLPAKYRTATPETCDHCQTRRRRRDTYVVRKVAGEELQDGVTVPSGRYAAASLPAGTWLQVGRNCLADFFPGADPHKLAAQLEMLLSACSAATSASMADEGLGGGGGARGALRWPLRHVLALAACMVRVEGWVSRGKARALADDYGGTGPTATADLVSYYLNPPSGGRALEEWHKFAAAHRATDADRATADAAHAHAREDLADRGDDRDDYQHNLYVACAQASIDARLLGIVCSLVPYYLRHVESVARKAAFAAGIGRSSHVGAVGDKLGFEALTLVRVTPCEGSYGTTYLHTFRDPAGNVLKWFASNKCVVQVAAPAPGGGTILSDEAMVEGQTYAVWGTVKAHIEYRGTAETQLTRCVVTTPAQMAATKEAEAAKAARKVVWEAKKAAKAAKIALRATSPVVA